MGTLAIVLFAGEAPVDRRKLVGLMGTISPWMSGGAAVHPAELMKALSQRYAFKALTPAKVSHVEDSGNYEVRTVRATPYVSTFSLVAGGIGFLRDVDLIHLHDPRLFLIKKVLRKPLVTTFHGYLTLEAMADYHTRPGLPRYEIYKRTVRWCVQASDYTIAVDSRIASWLTEEFSARNVCVIPNGVDVHRFRPMTAHRSVLDSLGIPAQGPMILAAKHFTPKNGMEHVVRAMPLVLREIPDAHLVLAGSGKLKDKLVSLIGELGIRDHVTMPGQIPNEYMPDVIASCDVGTIPSMPVSGVEEATSILMLEMMACGKLVIASAIGGLRETIRNGETGLLVEPGQPASLARALVAALNDAQLRSGIGGRARKYVEIHHSWEAVADRVAEVYEGLLGG